MSRAKFFVPFVMIILLAGCSLPNVVTTGLQTITGSGDLVTLDQDASDFSRVDISNAFRAEITEGESYSVSITVDDNLQQYLEVNQSGDTLSIGLEQGIIVRNGTMEASITMPELTGLDASGATNVRYSGFESDDALNVAASGASTVNGDIESGDLTANVSGASTLTLDGSGGDIEIKVSGASRADLSDYEAQDATVEASGASTAIVNVSGRLNAEAAGASTVQYTGDPTLGTIQESGASNVRPR